MCQEIGPNSEFPRTANDTSTVRHSILYGTQCGNCILFSKYNTRDSYRGSLHSLCNIDLARAHTSACNRILIADIDDVWICNCWDVGIDRPFR